MRFVFLIMAPLLFAINIFAMELEFTIDLKDTNALPSGLSKAIDEAYSCNFNGLKLLEKKDLDGALKMFNDAVVKFPDYDDAINNKGVVFYRKGLVSDAKKIWENLASRNPEYAIASYNIALVYLHDHQYDAAKKLFERAMKFNKNFIEALTRYGYLEMQSGDKGKGLDALKRAYKISPDFQDSWSFLAHGLILNGDTAEALAIIKKKEPDAEALKMHGMIEAARKNYVAAADLLSRAINGGADPSILVQLASVNVESGKCKEALDILNKYFAIGISHEADAWLLAGIAAKECNNIEKSEYYFEQGVKHYPHDAILRYNLGQVYFHLKKGDDAEETWNSLADSMADPSLYYMRAMNAQRKNKLDNAIKFISKAIEMDERAEYIDFLGVIYHRKGDDKAAEEQFRKALKKNPDLKSAQLNLALISQKGTDLSAAITPLEESLKKCDSDSCTDIAIRLSILYYHSKMVNKAIDLLNSVKETDKDESVYRHLAIYYKDLNDWNKAIATLESASKRIVLEPQTEYELAEAYLLAGMYQKAVDKFNQLLPKWTQNPWRLHYQTGYAYLEQNNLLKAKEYFEKSLKSKADNVAARGLLAFVLNRLGNVEDARLLWEKNLRDDPNNPSIWINMGLSYEKDGKYADALEYYKKAAALKNDKELQINVGNAYMGLGKYSEAIDSYNQALNTSKRDLAAYNIFLVARKKKDREKAEKTMEILTKEFSTSVFTKRANSELALWNSDTLKAISILEGISDKDESDWISLALLYASKKNRDKANACLSNVKPDEQNRKAIDNVKAQIAFSEGNFDQALKMMKQSSDTSFITQYNIALTAYNAKHFADALQLAEKLGKTATGTDKADLCRLAGNSAFALKQWQNARQWYLQLSNVDARNPVVQYNLAVAAYNLNQIQESWKYYQRAKELDPSVFNKDIEAKYQRTQNSGTTAVVVDTVDSWYNKAVDLQTAGDDSGALKLYLKVVEKDPLYSLAWNNLGAIYGKKGDIDNAEKAYMKAVEKKHDIPETYANLVNLYIELEEFSKAKQWIIKGIGHNPESQLLVDMREKIAVAEENAKKNTNK